MTEREALKLALEALEAHADIGIKADKAITAIKEALAQPEHGWTPERIAGMARLKDAQDKKLAQLEQEPVAWGIANTAIIGGKQLMMVRLEIPSGAPYPEVWIPLYTKETL